MSFICHWLLLLGQQSFAELDRVRAELVEDEHDRRLLHDELAIHRNVLHYVEPRLKALGIVLFHVLLELSRLPLELRRKHVELVAIDPQERFFPSSNIASQVASVSNAPFQLKPGP